MTSLKINRAELLQSLQAVRPGLSKPGNAKEGIIQQSTCVVFKDGYLITFNEEAACRMRSPLVKVKFTGAMAAAPLIKILGKLDEEYLNVEITGEKFVISGLQRKTTIRLEKEISLPIDAVERPGKEWKPLHKDFLTAVDVVHECAGSDEKMFALTCVHFHPKWIEAFDNTQLSRFYVKTGVDKECLVRKEYIRYITELEMVEFNETEAWIHFRNEVGLVLSCRRHQDSFKDLSSVIDFTGDKVQLPPGLAEAAERAEIFSQENESSNRVLIQLKPGKMRIKGEGNSGWYAEVKNVKYKGPELSFVISPKLLIQLVKKHNECEVTRTKLKVNGGKYVYVASLISNSKESTNGTSDKP